MLRWGRRLGLGGCAAGCAAPLLILVLIVAVVVAVGAAFFNALGSLVARPGAPGAQPGGTAYYATVGGAPTIHDLGFGSSDAARLDRALAAVRANSPLVGRGALLLRLGQEHGIDPLLLVGMWQAESQLCLDGLNTPQNGNWNCGNMIWPAARPYPEHGCSAGETSLNHLWARCPTAEGGIGVWFEYLAKEPSYDRARPDFFAVMRIYNPCSDPGNAANGFPCGDQYGRNILATIARAAGEPVAYQPPPGGGGAGACGPALPLGDAEANLTLPPAAAAVMGQVFGGRAFPVTQGWGPSRIPGEPAYLGYAHFHKGVDWGAPEGTPLLAPAAGVAVQRVGNLGNLIVDLRLPDGSSYSFFHLSRQLASGPVAAGAPIGLVGSTGYSTGPHLHLEKADARGAAVPPEHWTCGGGPVGGGPATTQAAGEYVFPIQGYTGQVAPHHGTGRTAADLFAPQGTPVLAMRGGRVTGAGEDDIGGFYVYIDADDGNDYYYAHLVGSPRVAAGQRVTAGQVLGGVGDTGNAKGTGHHLHLGIGPRIVTGTGAAGGGGSDNYNATGLLQRVLACCVAR